MIRDNALHELGNNIDSSSGLTSKGDCIDIKHSGSILECDFFDIIGAGSGTGLRILPGAARTTVQNCDGDGFEGWAVDLEDDASRANLVGNDFDGNGIGLLLKGARWSVIADFSAEENTANGIVLKNSNNNVFQDWLANSNGADNIDLFSSNGNTFADGDADGSVAGNGIALKGSRKNVIIGTDTDDNALDGIFADPSSSSRISDGLADDNHKNGVELAKGSKNTTVSDYGAGGNSGTDLLDGNTNCDKNIWSNNCFNTASPACASNPFPGPC